MSTEIQNQSTDRGDSNLPVNPINSFLLNESLQACLSNNEASESLITHLTIEPTIDPDLGNEPGELIENIHTPPRMIPPPPFLNPTNPSSWTPTLPGTTESSHLSLPQDFLMFEEGDQSDKDQNETQDGKSPRVRLTMAQKSKEFGNVEGTQRGSIPYIIPRSKSLRGRIADLTTSTNRYNRELPLIISRAERLSNETDAYILVLAQQAKGSSAAVHFVSPRLRREAPDDTIALVNQFQTLMTNLSLAKRAEALELTKQLQTAQAALTNAQEQTKVAEDTRKNAELLLKQKDIELGASQAMAQRLLEELSSMQSNR
ncbi:hypothetical protein AGABI1DRAFT_129324 [Agaricus bisporus var. burnettii JB137-S8]|uniref:Uncharacterized protein n=1 Tax=Agaricus bisporus var. burnettii (strain JB137-S8 / ATCC MYA-4627 / FGSC 10392) TaxID=597362 RepID=K5XT68_AGABU|nr:uncharacterized protein AGABI1DRAFT_129324 [Agaricus bisporus var. burnettii JB137-S8]EKM78195.1 hypothetical protein AGABI1DRAFT_129324 [Agaricus bisporus var. burnettii JB137-S8]